jgi:hypothetical protein
LPCSIFSTSSKHPYAGSQPSIIRTALKALGSLDCFTFIDLGCGKGRPLLGVPLQAPLPGAGALIKSVKPGMRAELGS